MLLKCLIKGCLASLSFLHKCSWNAYKRLSGTWLSIPVWNQSKRKLFALLVLMTEAVIIFQCPLVGGTRPKELLIHYLLPAILAGIDLMEQNYFQLRFEKKGIASISFVLFLCWFCPRIITRDYRQKANIALFCKFHKSDSWKIKNPQFEGLGRSNVYTNPGVLEKESSDLKVLAKLQ